jgi:hypothetical protein
VLLLRYSDATGLKKTERPYREKSTITGRNLRAIQVGREEPQWLIHQKENIHDFSSRVPAPARCSVTAFANWLAKARAGIPVALAACAIAALAAPPAAAATATATPPRSQFVQIINWGGKCLDMAGGAKANNTAADLWSCNGKGWQYWDPRSVNVDGKIFYVLENFATGKCLSLLHDNPNFGAQVIQQPCNLAGKNTFEDWFQWSDGEHKGFFWTFFYNRDDISGRHECFFSYHPVSPCALHPGGKQNGAKVYVNKSTNDGFLWRSGRKL